MPEQERLDTLTDLIAAKKVTNDKLEKLPIQIKSLKVAAHKRELEDKLTRLERAIETFSRPKVYVKFWCWILSTKFTVMVLIDQLI